tara:strand:+ start:280 stop:822 length:543 start_codon:yes stop_codon:yes gene_type:complete
MKPCPKCQKLHIKPGIFCSRSCANSRIQTEEIRKKKSISAKRWLELNGHPQKGKPGRLHSLEDKEKIRNGVLNKLKEIGHVNRTPEQLALKNRITASRYRAKQKNATPANANKELIKKIYEYCPEGYEVDHAIALAEGGLHHENNLQYLPILENRRKNKTQNYNRSLIINWKDVIYTEAG